MHKFNPENIHRLESQERKEKLPPDVIVDKIKIAEGAAIADIGCGIGYFTIELAKKAGKKGMVYAVDISDDLLDVLKGKIEGINNIIPILSEENEFKIEEKTIDLVFMAFILHEATDKNLFISKAIKLLRENGQIVVIDWQKKQTQSGPPVEDRLSIEEVETLLSQYQFKKVQEIEQHEDIYFLIFQSDV